MTAATPAVETHDLQVVLTHRVTEGHRTASTLPVGKANRIVVYTASWCQPCQRLKPEIAALARQGYQVVYRDIDKDMDRLEYPYGALPTIFFLSGEAVIKKETGYRSREQIKQTLVLETGPAIAERALIQTPRGWQRCEGF